MDQGWECAVVGAGAAGLSAALVLGRARRRTVVIDAGEQSNRASDVIGGLLGFDRRRPAELYEAGRQELSAYPSVEYRRGQVRSGHRVGDRFVLRMGGGEEIRARRVLLATGMQYCPTDLPGVSELWGSTVFQCPFCHGWEMRDTRLAAIASDGVGTHHALLLRGWTDDVVLLTNGRQDLSSDEVQRLRTGGVGIDDRPIAALIGKDGELAEIEFTDGTRMARDGVLIEAPLRQRSALAEQLGADCTDSPVADDTLAVDAFHRTSADGVFAAGDNCTEAPHLGGAIESGAKTAMLVVQSLLADEVGLPFPPA